MEITKYLISIMIIIILSNNVECGLKKPNGATLEKTGARTTVATEGKTAEEQSKQGTSIKILL